MKQLEVEVIQKFTDLSADKLHRAKASRFMCDEQRAKELIEKGLVKQVRVVPNVDKQVAEIQKTLGVKSDAQEQVERVALRKSTDATNKTLIRKAAAKRTRKKANKFLAE